MLLTILVNIGILYENNTDIVTLLGQMPLAAM